VARILIAARAQPVVAPGRKIRSLEQGKTYAEAIWLRASEGADFGQLARESSDDPDVIRKEGGVVPIWITAATTGYEDTFLHAEDLEPGAISKPWFSAGRGYVIVKLLEKKEAAEFEDMRQKILADAAAQKYRAWQAQSLNEALKSASLLEER
jgi:parvulin-like peptidyl-prolyl isomerase